ncbi:hypothetical protein E6P09_11670 [Haloferax mediterranei ATCC 33500]|nr:hypothetical protein [Haloferax mediterranei]AHZ21214.1 hypothetical protein BM92_00460 [Haloferax mediterranei ATCC 33500]EMA04375.1 hypothetical protein C439_01832 [Haloferax mediterranei ATCC 33500]MDX5989540.1 hypothetical protein [Haloferax mediterranei ATCC 33500]QCQ75896.1 hypothetical protein E6P09_11670 [Haloferax mediterranei ATCC 33500]
MKQNSLALAIAFGAVVVGLAVLLISEAAGASELIIAIGGGIALVGVGVLTAVVMRLPEPSGESGTAGEHEHEQMEA